MKLRFDFNQLTYRLFILVLILFLNNNSFAQEANKDVVDVVRKWKGDTTARQSTQMEVGKEYLSILPIVGYGPAFGFLAGGAVSLSKILGEPPTKASSALANFQVTTKHQFILNVRSKIYLENNKWFLQGDWRLLLYDQPTYGLGINKNDAEKGLPNAPGELSEEITGEPMRFKQIRFFEEAARQIGNSNFYAGLGIAIDQYFSITDQMLDTVAGSPDYFITSHYSYSSVKRFDPVQYGTNGIKLSFLTDTRDNIANAYKGYYASLSLLNNLKIGNNSRQSTQVQYDGRYYWGVLKHRPRQVLALWSFGSFLLAGDIPYLALPSIGWDTYNRSGRGYIQGRYRGLNMLYNEAEYRFPISKNNLYGATAFVNATNVSSETQNLMQRTAIGYGLGLRLQADKIARINLTVDVGMAGREFGGIYFNLQESF
jgi:outer membrane protein assembly factor BamA